MPALVACAERLAAPLPHPLPLPFPPPQPAADPRLDPRIDPRKAKRILANRLSAAKSKMKQKSVVDAAKAQVGELAAQRDALAAEVQGYSSAVATAAAEQQTLLQQLQVRQGCLGRAETAAACCQHSATPACLEMGPAPCP